MSLSDFVEVSEVLRSGVYALAYKGEVVYIGKSKCMLTRVETHRGLFRRKAPAWMPVKGVQFDQVYVRPCPLAMLDALEVEMINLYKPRLNERLKTNEKIKAEINIVVAGKSLTLNRRMPQMERRL